MEMVTSELEWEKGITPPKPATAAGGLVKSESPSMDSVVEQVQVEGVACFASRPRLSREEFARRLRDLADGRPLPTLPADFSRADIYDDHD